VKKWFAVIPALVLLTLAGHANAQVCVSTAQNCGPPHGSFLDLSVPNSDGSGNTTSVPKTYTTYTANFTAIYALTYLTFAFRDDNANLELANVSLADAATPATNLLLNGNFALGVVGHAQPLDWLYNEPAYLANSPFSGFTGKVGSACGPGGVNCYTDGSVQGYDEIAQGVATTIGDTYTLTFQLDENGGPGPGGLTTFRQLSNNGHITDASGNGIDLLAYQEQAPAWVPEPASLVVMGSGLLGLALGRRRKRN
jgi:hypothetical protein